MKIRKSMICPRLTIIHGLLVELPGFGIIYWIIWFDWTKYTGIIWWLILLESFESFLSRPVFGTYRFVQDFFLLFRTADIWEIRAFFLPWKISYVFFALPSELIDTFFSYFCVKIRVNWHIFTYLCIYLFNWLHITARVFLQW